MSKNSTKRRGKKASSRKLAEKIPVKSFFSLENPAFSQVNPLADNLPDPADDSELLRLIGIGSRKVVTSTIQTLHVLKFAQVGEWSRLLPAPNPGKVMSILTKRMRS
jgi:predicted flap endonuclease-1-like 5' DNA nuclease